MSKVLLGVCVASFLVLQVVHGGNIMTKLHYKYSNEHIAGDVNPNFDARADYKDTSAFYRSRSVLQRNHPSSVVIAQLLKARDEEVFTAKTARGEEVVVDRPVNLVHKSSNQLSQDESYPVHVPQVKPEAMKTYRQKVNIGRAILRQINQQRLKLPEGLSAIKWNQPLYDFMNLVKHEFVRLRIGFSTQYDKVTLEEFIAGNKDVQKLLNTLPVEDQTILSEIGKFIQVDIKTYACPLNFVKGWQGAYDETMDWIDAIRDRPTRELYDAYIASLAGSSDASGSAVEAEPEIDPAVREAARKAAFLKRFDARQRGAEDIVSPPVEVAPRDDLELPDDLVDFVQVGEQTAAGPTYQEWFAEFETKFDGVKAYKAAHGFMDATVEKREKHPAIDVFRGHRAIGSAAIIPGRKMNALMPFPGYMCYYVAALYLAPQEML